jgi:hypothetical protein
MNILEQLNLTVYPANGLPTPAEGKKWQTIWAGSVYDEAVNVPVGGTNYSDTTIADLVANNPSIFALVYNPNGQIDLAVQVATTVTYIIGSFIAYGVNVAYNAQSWDLVGGQPKTRCPQC